MRMSLQKCGLRRAVEMRVSGDFFAFFRAPTGELRAKRLKMAITFALRAALWQFDGCHP